MRTGNVTYKNFMIVVLLFVCLLFSGCALTKSDANSTYSASYRKNAMSTEDSSLWYYYNQLNDKEKIWYEDIYLALKTMEERELYPGNISGIGVAGIDWIFQCVMDDHPEIFYVDGYSYSKYSKGDKLFKITLLGKFTMEKEERDRMQAKIDSKVRYILADVPSDASEYEKVKFVYEYVIKHTGYDKEAPDNQNVISVFVGGKSVCQGYAKAVQYLLYELGISASLVPGSVYNGDKHAINLVCVDGEYYYVDATWGDASYQSETTKESVAYLPGVNYDYLCVTTDVISRTHRLEAPTILPSCKSMAANYYVMENAYFESFDDNAFEAFIKAQKEAGKKEISLKCSDEAVFYDFKEELIGKQKIFSYLNAQSKKVAYTLDERKLSMTFWLVNE